MVLGSARYEKISTGVDIEFYSEMVNISVHLENL